MTIVDVHKSSGSLLLHVPDPLRLREVLPQSKLLPAGRWNLAIRHTLENVKILRNVGVTAPAPILTDYSWPGKYRPFDHQRAMAEFLTLHRRCFNLSEMGTGKTASTLWAIDWLMQTGRVRRALILTPLSTMHRVWQSDAFDVIMHRSVRVVYGPKQKRLDQIASSAEILVMNHDGLLVSGVVEALRSDPDIDLVVIDEASMFRNHGTARYKALRKLIRPEQRLWLLTGTPCPNDPTDAWAIANLVSPDRVPKFFGSFQRQTMVNVSRFKWVARHDAYDTVYNALQPAIRFRKADCLDLPPVVTMDRQASLTAEQRQAYKQMQQHMRAEAETSVISAANAADKINKLRQILCGSIKDPDTGEYVDLPHGPRLDVLTECIEQASAKVLVVVPFKGIIRSLEADLAKRWSVGMLNGDVSVKRRDQIVHEFKTGPDPHVLLCHPRVMSHGLNLTEADTLVFYGPIYSNDQVMQVVERFNRTGQTRKMTVIRIAAHPIEWQIYKMVDTRGTTQNGILELFRRVTDAVDADA